MATLLTPNAATKIYGVTVREKIIPDGTRWKNSTKAANAGFSANSLYKKQAKLCGTGKAKYVTIHNTEDLKNVNDDAEQYTRATYNENMGSARIHFYVDNLGAWQNLRAGTGVFAADPLNSAEVSWHSGDGSIADGGNMTSISIEVIMSESTTADHKARDNAARLAAWLLWRHGLTIDRLVTHTYWVNKSVGKKFNDVDEQCTNYVPGKKWCPYYIFGGVSKATALKNWKAFKDLVGKYLGALDGSKVVSDGTKTETKTETETAPIITNRIKVGSTVKVRVGAKTYNGVKLANFVYARAHKVKQINGDRVVITFNGVVVAAVRADDLILV